ncbi:MAG: SDR family oxidoreductase [Bacillati bacterium ANGP1]|uniref:SDR family oxidoreductase n=2 Tax=Candidatus Segetimicrobium genomatis TaxID=2569760 RepID=A0A537J362_9BACT|nr:MAG: SDR family oxidoreductase [Terrabacteria group bacterium ANGP1]
MSSLLVTGAGGYIGSVLTRMLLEHGDSVTAVDRFFFGRQTLPPDDGRLRVIEGDIRTLQQAELRGIDAVIDLAALSNDPAGELESEKTWAINHAGRVRIATLAKQAGVPRYILPSSCSVYGFQEGLLDERSPVNPLTTYAKANRQAEGDTLALADAGFCVVVLRQATVYGLSPRMRFDLAINGMVRGLFKQGKIPLLRDGTQWRPFVHVRDTARAMMLMLEARPERVNAQIFNVGSDDQNCQIMPLAKTVAEAMGIRFDYEWYGLPDHRSYRVSFQKVREAVGFHPACSPSDGAREVYEALRSGAVDPDDPRTITVGWYKHLIETSRPRVLL